MGFFDKFRKKKKVAKKKKKSVGTTVEVKKPIKKKPVGTVGTSDVLIKDWVQTIKKLEKHPLSQLRLINTSILEQLAGILESINSKLDKLSKLDEIINLLTKEKHKLKEAGMPTETLDDVIAKLKVLSTKDKEAIEVLKDAGPITTEHFAKKVGLSRSTASSRLNKLHSIGLLKKTANGKKILFELDKKF